MININFNLSNDVFKQQYTLKFKNSYCVYDYNIQNQERVLEYIIDMIINMNNGEII